MTVRMAAVCCTWLVSMLASHLLAEDAPPRIKPEEARQYADKQVEVIFEVKASKYSEKRKTAYLDSEANFQDEKNLGLAITEKGIMDLKQKRAVEGPADFYRGKTVRALGTVLLKDDKPYIEINEAAQLDLAPQ